MNCAQNPISSSLPPPSFGIWDPSFRYFRGSLLCRRPGTAIFEGNEEQRKRRRLQGRRHFVSEPRNGRCRERKAGGLGGGRGDRGFYSFVQPRAHAGPRFRPTLWKRNSKSPPRSAVVRGSAAGFQVERSTGGGSSSKMHVRRERERKARDGRSRARALLSVRMKLAWRSRGRFRVEFYFRGAEKFPEARGEFIDRLGSTGGQHKASTGF